MRNFKSITTLALVFVALFQLSALGSRVWNLEAVLTTGERHLFKAAPVDPVDYFSGRYVAINLDGVTFKVGEEELRNFDYGRKRWVAIEKGEDGFSRFSGYTEETGAGPRVFARTWVSGKEEVRVDPPFSRFYMNEKLAPRAEAAYNRAAMRDGKRDAWVAVRIKDGVGVIEELYIGGKPVSEYLKEQGEGGK